jgi:hypothetical protein
MPDWYIQRNSPESPYPYSIRMGGCEYSLTEQEFGDIARAVWAVWEGRIAYAESEGYAHINYAGPDKVDLRKLIKVFDETPMRRI